MIWLLYGLTPGVSRLNGLSRRRGDVDAGCQVDAGCGVDAGCQTAIGIIPRAKPSPISPFRAEGSISLPSGGRELPAAGINLGRGLPAPQFGLSQLHF